MNSNGNLRHSVPKSIGYVALWTDQPEALRDFFVTMFHYEVAYEDESIVVFDMDGDTDLILQRVDEETSHLNGTTQFGLYVEDVAALTETLRQRGATFAEQGTDLGDAQFLSIVRAPTGHAIELVGSSAE